MSGDGTEYFGLADTVPAASAEAVRSFASAMGITEARAADALASGAAVGMLGQRAGVEYRQSWRCTSCGGALMHRGQLCRCGRAAPGESVRAKPMPWDCIDGADALAQLRRRFVVPL